MLLGWRECKACKGVWDKEVVRPYEVPNRTIDDLLDEMQRIFASIQVTQGITP